MTNKELRIGNKLYRSGIIVTIDSRSIFDMDSGNDEYSPIPLTPNILEKCGFEHGLHMPLKDTPMYLELCADAGSILKDRKEWSYHIRLCSHNCEESDLKPFYNATYLHQLQNLYFSLTGTELSITF